MKHNFFQPGRLGIYDLIKIQEDEEGDGALHADRVTQTALKSFGEGFRLET